MRLKSIHVFGAVLTIFILFLPYSPQGATVAPAIPGTLTTPSTGAIQPAIQNPSAPPQGSITIPASTNPIVNASVWPTGSYQQLQWVCNGTRSQGVNVTLWSNQYKIATLGTGIYTGKTAWTVPITASGGNYELRITSVDDPRVEARKPITIRLAAITIKTPNSSAPVYLGGQYNITWTYDGNPGPIEFKLEASGEGGSAGLAWQQFPGSISQVTMANGYGFAAWKIPDQPFWDGYYKLSIFRLTIKGTTNTKISAYSEFKITCRTTHCILNNQQWCADLQTSTGSCGSCGNNCGLNLRPEYMTSGYVTAVCVKGQCQCAPGWTGCTGKTKVYCADLKKDSRNCGACGKTCTEPFNWCIDGTCKCSPYKSTVCALPTMPPTFVCSNLKIDSQNCGSCGKKCSSPTPYCNNGVCSKDDPLRPPEPPDLYNYLPSPI